MSLRLAIVPGQPWSALSPKQKRKKNNNNNKTRLIYNLREYIDI